MKGQVRQRIESIESELQRLKDELQPEIEVGSWWVGNQSREKVQVAKITKQWISYTYNKGNEWASESSEFTKFFTPCEAPVPLKETWYLCAMDYTPSACHHTFKRGEEYKLMYENNSGKRFEIKSVVQFIKNPQERGIMVSPQQR
jgi:hypothetical protein